MVRTAGTAAARCMAASDQAAADAAAGSMSPACRFASCTNRLASWALPPALPPLPLLLPLPLMPLPPLLFELGAGGGWTKLRCAATSKAAATSLLCTSLAWLTRRSSSSAALLHCWMRCSKGALPSVSGVGPALVLLLLLLELPSPLLALPAAPWLGLLLLSWLLLLVLRPALRLSRPSSVAAAHVTGRRSTCCRLLAAAAAAAAGRAGASARPGVLHGVCKSRWRE